MTGAVVTFVILSLLWVYVYGTGETVTIVGDHDPALLKYFDCTRSGPRSAFDSNVVYQFEIMEYVSFFLDFHFRLDKQVIEIHMNRGVYYVLINQC